MWVETFVLSATRPPRPAPVLWAFVIGVGRRQTESRGDYGQAFRDVVPKCQCVYPSRDIYE